MNTLNKALTALVMSGSLSLGAQAASRYEQLADLPFDEF